MADDALGKLIPLVIVGAIGYWAYETFFATPAAPAATAPATGPGTNAQPNTTIAPVVTTPPKPAGPCGTSGVLAPWLGIVQKAYPSGNYGEGLPGTLTIDEWCYYGDQECTGICPQVGLTADALFAGRDDRGGPLNWSAFKGYATQQGLSGLGTHAVRRLS